MQQQIPNNNHIPQPSFNQNYMQKLMINPEDISDPTTVMNMALVLIAKAFKLNYSTPTNNNQKITSNPRNMQIAQPVQDVGNQNANQNGNANVVAAWAEGNGNEYNRNQVWCYNCRGMGHLARNCIVRPWIRDVAYLQTQLLIAQKEEARIQLQAEEFDLMDVLGDINEIEEVNANCILIANLQQASTSGTQTDKVPVYDKDGSAKNDSNVIFAMSSVEQSGGTIEQNSATVEETRALYDSLYNNLAIEGDLKGKSKDTRCVSDTLDPLSQILKDENVSEQKDTTKGTGENTKFANQSTKGTKLYSGTPLPKPQFIPKVVESNYLSNPVTSNSVPTTKESKVMKNDNVIAPGMFRINPLKTSREGKFVPINKARASVRTNPIIVSQPHIITKKDVNSNSNGFSSTGVDNDNIKYLILFGGKIPPILLANASLTLENKIFSINL
ncbi:retrovirus-related pol polyprotein from transposon TNT 1-94 [Tanacetum coccineum]